MTDDGLQMPDHNDLKDVIQRQIDDTVGFDQRTLEIIKEMLFPQDDIAKAEASTLREIECIAAGMALPYSVAKIRALLRSGLAMILRERERARQAEAILSRVKMVMRGVHTR